MPFLGGVADGPGCQLWTQDRSLAAISSNMSSELAAAWRYTYWLECLIVSILDEAGNVSGNSQIHQKRQHLEVCNAIHQLSLLHISGNMEVYQALVAILKDYTAVTGGKNAYRPADAVLRPLLLASNSSTITLPASSVQV